MSSPLTALPWLPEIADFRARVKDAVGAPGLGSACRFIASHRLDVNQLALLSRTIRSADATALEPLERLKLAIVGLTNLDFLPDALIGTAARHGVALEAAEFGYGQAAQQILDPESELYAGESDAILLALDWTLLKSDAPIGSAAAAEAELAKATALVDRLRASIRESSDAVAIVTTIAPPADVIFGSADIAIPGTPRSLVDAFNRHLATTMATGREVMLDVAGLAAAVGLADWSDPRQRHHAKLMLALDCVPLFADHVGRILGALRGKSRKCLVLDLDNTLWGGIVGDDGVEGLALGQGSARGEAHLELQRYALKLKERGIILAVCSKNETSIALEAFRTHPEMLLKEEDLAVFQANWSDKAANLKAIAKLLDIGTDSLVFVDDNPFERAQVRSALPEVAVPELADDPSYFAETLSAAGYFEATAFSDEDRKRSALYQQKAQTAQLEAASGNLEEFLASLDMKAEVRAFQPDSVPRIAQLINKSNQFNLTTRRYTEPQVADMLKDDQVHSVQIRLTDRFGDNGLISVLIVRKHPDEWFIDTWLMSCRVLKRGVEEIALREIAAQARGEGARALIGVYKPTTKNVIVKDHYAQLGFRPADPRPFADGEGAWWELPLESYEPKASFIEVV